MDLFTSRVLERSPTLQLLSIFSTGYNNVDLPAARRCGLTVTNVPGYSSHSVAEHAWAMILHLAKRLCRKGQSLNQSGKGERVRA